MHKTNILVTGSAGFLGGRTAKYFASINDRYSVLATSRRSERKAELEASECAFRSGDLLDPEHCNQITSNIQVIVHCAALSAPWGPYQDFYNANYLATQNLFNAAIRNGVKRFIYISTPSIYFDYRDKFMVRETDELPAQMPNHYASTKLLTERFVLNHPDPNIQTLALRPRAIIGAEDTVIMPRLIRAYHSGKLKVIGDGNNVCDLTTVRNVIAAIECAMHSNEESLNRAYNISNGEPVVLWEKINRMLEGLGFDPLKKKVPKALALFYASMIEKKQQWLNPAIEPDITRYGIGTLGVGLTMDISAAQKYLNYKPVQTTDEGLLEFIAWYRNQK